MQASSSSFVLRLSDADATTALGQALSRLCAAGDCLLLQGPIGSGKTHLARALIGAQLERAGLYEDIPSPTFTLVQVYETPEHEIWHADLYRLGHPQEVIELGLEAAFDEALCIIEWPDRLGDLTPPQALHLDYTPLGEGRALTITGPGPRISALLADPEIRSFLS